MENVKITYTSHCSVSDHAVLDVEIDKYSWKRIWDIKSPPTEEFIIESIKQGLSSIRNRQSRDMQKF